MRLLEGREERDRKGNQFKLNSLTHVVVTCSQIIL